MAAQSRLIKKYPNRRLYDTRTSTYITLVDIKELVLGHEEFQVVDAKSGDDLTRAILLQVILEYHFLHNYLKMVQKCHRHQK